MANPIDDLLKGIASVFRNLQPESPVVQRFRESMQIDYWKWHDGIGYNIELLKQATPSERRQIEALVMERGARDWRDVEALAALQTPQAVEELRQALHRGAHAIAMAVLAYAPRLVSVKDRTAALVAAIEGAEIGSGLAEALRLIKLFHPPEVIDALFRAVLIRHNVVLLVAMLMFLCGLAKSDFDYDLRPFYFRFQSEDRAAPFRELCEKAGVDAERYLRTR